MRNLPAAWPFGLVALVVAFWLVRIVRPGSRITLVSYDSRTYFYPLYEAFYGRLAAGKFSAWNPYQLCGLPWLGTLQGGFFYPPHALYLALPTNVALAVSGFGHLVFIALTTAAFARRAGLMPVAAMLAGVLFTLRGSIARLLLWPYTLEAVAWLPLGSLAVLELTRGGGRRAVALLGGATGMSVLAGSPQGTVFIGYAWGTLLVALLAGERASARAWALAGGRFAAGIGFGGVVGAVQLLPALEMARVGTRAAHALSFAAMLPFGNPGFQLVWEAITGGPLSFGVVALALIPAAIFGRGKRTLAVWAFAFGIVVFLLAMGPATPLFRLYLVVPFLTQFRSPARMIVIAQWAAAILAATALHAIVQRAGARQPRGADGGRVRRALVLGPTIFCALAFAAILFARHVFVPATLGAATGALLLLAVRRPLPVVGASLVLLAASEAIFEPGPRERLPYDQAAAAVYERYGAMYALLTRIQGSDRVWVVNPFLNPDLAPKLASRHGVRSVEDYEPLNLRRQADYFTFLMEGATTRSDPNLIFQGGFIPPAVSSGRMAPVLRRRLLDLAAVRLIVIPDNFLGRPAIAKIVAGNGLVRREAVGERLTLFENPASLPRAFIVYRTRAAPPPDALLAALSRSDFDPLVESYVEGDPGFVATPTAPRRGTAATFVHDGEDVVELDVDAAAPGLVVLADSFAPGWRATVDGADTPIVATNHLFRGVAVDTGHHRVRFVYSPWTVPVGAASTALALATLGVLARPPRRSRPT